MTYLDPVDILAARSKHTGPDGHWPPRAKPTTVHGPKSTEKHRKAYCQFELCSGERRGKISVARAHFGVLEGIVDGKVLGVRDACGGCVTLLGLTNRIDLSHASPLQCAGAIRNSIKYHSGKKQLMLSFDEILELLQTATHCAATGRPLSETEKNACKFGSLDRIDARLPYVRGNVIVVSNAVNEAKSDCTPGALVQRCREIEFARASAPGKYELPTARMGGDKRTHLRLSGSDGLIEGKGQVEIALVTSSSFAAHKRAARTTKSKKRRRQPFWPGIDEGARKDAYYSCVIGPRLDAVLAAQEPLPPPQRGFWCGRFLSGMRSLDRADNDRGYGEEGQVHLLCCSDCNVMRWSQSMEEFERMCSSIVSNADRYLEAVEAVRATYVPTPAMPSLPLMDDTNSSSARSKGDVGVRNVYNMVRQMYLADAAAALAAPNKKRKRVSWRELGRRGSLPDGSRGTTTEIIKELLERPAGHRFLFAAAPDPIAALASRTLPEIPSEWRCSARA